MPYIITNEKFTIAKGIKVSLGVVTLQKGFLKGELVPTEEIFTLGNLHLELSRTVNLGDYNSMQVKIGVHHPYEVDDLNTTYETVSKWMVEKFIVSVKSLV